MEAQKLRLNSLFTLTIRVANQTKAEDSPPQLFILLCGFSVTQTGFAYMPFVFCSQSLLEQHLAVVPSLLAGFAARSLRSKLNLRCVSTFPTSMTAFVLLKYSS